MNELLNSSPYSEISPWKKFSSMVLEIPSGATSILMRFLKLEKENLISADSVLKIATRQIDMFGDNPNPEIESFLGRGYESLVFSFIWNNKRWVIKMGLKQGFTSGLKNPSSNEYALNLKYGYSILRKIFEAKMPFLLPKPIFILPPNKYEIETTVQIMPFIERIQALEKLQKANIQCLILERLRFYLLSKKMVEKFGAFVDTIGPGNLIIGNFEDGVHFSLIDVGLFFQMAPIPLILILERQAQELSLISDLIKLKRIQKNI